MAGAVHRAFRRTGWTCVRPADAAAFCVAGAAFKIKPTWSADFVAGAVHRAAAAFCVGGAQISWQAQYAEPSGGAAERMVEAGPRLPFVGQAQHLVNVECRFCGRRRVDRASRRSCGTHNRRWAAAAFCMAGTALGERGVQILWQAQGTQSLQKESCAVAAGPRLPFSWQAQRFMNVERRFRGRRSTQSLQEELRDAWSPLGCGCLERRLRGRPSAQSFQEELRNAWSPLGRGCLLCGGRHSAW